MRIIACAMWLYCRFTQSYRDVEELLFERGMDVSYEIVRRWCMKHLRCTIRKQGFGRARIMWDYRDQAMAAWAAVSLPNSGLRQLFVCRRLK